MLKNIKFRISKKISFPILLNIKKVAYQMSSKFVKIFIPPFKQKVPKEFSQKCKGIFEKNKVNMSVKYGSFDTNIAILYDTLCHMAYVMKCHKMTFYGNFLHFLIHAI